MVNYEYKILHGPPNGILLFPWASQELKDRIGRGSFEKNLNKLAKEGWEVISCSTSSEGNLFWLSPKATVLLRRVLPTGS